MPDYFRRLPNCSCRSRNRLFEKFPDRLLDYLTVRYYNPGMNNATRHHAARDAKGRFATRTINSTRNYRVWPLQREEAYKAVAIQQRNRTPRPAPVEVDALDFAALL